MPTSGKGIERLLLVDLCGTLYASNTTFDFLHFLLSESAEYMRFEAGAKGFLRRVANRVMPGDHRRERAIRFLAGYDHHQLLEAADIFLETIKPIDEVVDRVRQLQTQTDRTLLVSSSLDFIVERACNKLGFDGFRATKLDYADGICQGRITNDLLGVKHILIAREFSANECTLVTDNKSDAYCRGVVSTLVGVAAAGNREMVKFWSGRVDELVVYQG